MLEKSINTAKILNPVHLFSEEVIFYQLFEKESSTYTYLIADVQSHDGVIIDPVIETVDRDLQLIHELDIRLKYILDTHIHADHITGAGELRQRTGAKSCVSEQAGVPCVDVALKDGDELKIGNKAIQVIATPGHTPTCLTYYIAGAVFTGDSLLIRGTGRTDFQNGSSKDLFESIQKKLFTLPDNTLVYPGHDYCGQTKSTIGLEKRLNPRLGLHLTLDDFVKTMAELKLANPKKIHEAVAANLVCGKSKLNTALHPQMINGIPEVTAEDVRDCLGRVRIIDVRRPDEFDGELGHIPGAELITLGDSLLEFLNVNDRSEEMVFVCRSGGRSGQATDLSVQAGYKFTSNMVGGMLRWNELDLPITRT